MVTAVVRQQLSDAMMEYHAPFDVGLGAQLGAGDRPQP